MTVRLISNTIRTMGFLARVSVWSIATAGVAVICLALGAILGMSFEYANTQTDLCSDQTSGRYIFEKQVRERICQ